MENSPKINPEFRNLIPPLSPAELAGLEDSILRDGCRDALTTWNGLLLDGHHRWNICQKHKLPFKTAAVDLPDRTAAMLWIIDNQQHRRNLSDIDKIALARKREELLKPLAKENQRQSKGRGKKGGAKLRYLKTSREAAKAAGVSERTYDAGKAILDAVEKGELKPEVLDQLRRGETFIHRVCRGIKETQRNKKRKLDIAAVVAVPDPLAAGVKFATVVIDPPWDWSDEGDVDQMGRARPTYATMPLAELEKLPVPELMLPDSHLYLWITNRSLPKGFGLLDKWGFRYVTMLTWPKPSFGMGNYFRGQTEHVLFGVRGSAALLRKDASTLLPTWKRGPGGHSSKPPEFLEFVESCSHGPYLEMFARSQRHGWTGWGALQ